MADAVSDSEIIAMVRGGNLDAYDGLYARHVSIASTVARRNVDNLSDADDVVAEAFRSVLQSLVEGKGPEQFFRGYLLSTVTRLSHHRNRNARRALPTADEAVLDHKMTPGDPVVQAFESHTVARAFRSLPERWQSALWYLDVERMKPAVVAPILGLSPNAVSALGVRAREGLRKQYLQMHVSEIPQGACTKVVPQLGSYVRGGLSKHAEAKVRDHLDECAKCTAVLLDLRDVQATMRAVLLPLMTGVPLAAWGSGASGLGIAGQFATPAQARGPAPASTPLPIAVPVRTPAPTPTPTPTANRGKISGTASRTDTGADPTTATLETVFTLSRGIGNATADFSINAPGTISSGSVTAPSGWSCSAKPLDPSGISCTTNSAQPGELTFRLNVTVVNQGVHTLTYGLSGTGIATSTFRYDF
ncbi:zf-HC2 domain-containing protein [Arthrobacter bambusae]|uniref:zf-HC2 domain-containing protein n=1 Tax=Arthrobacter bambusae TaxID=1338426 RepID=UPI002789C72C|nr:sigma-70 family RNA polymerase sigma factor [Arthrobacter bambusae]MDQ0239332.1 RNA polymerase sigma factor (sigma-70 family) [Arthrobacter bambusae]